MTLPDLSILPPLFRWGTPLVTLALFFGISPASSRPFSQTHASKTFALASRFARTRSVAPRLAFSSEKSRIAARVVGSSSGRNLRGFAAKKRGVDSKGNGILESHYDLVIFGGGPTGCAAAERAAYKGMRAMVVDDPGKGTKVQLGGPTGLFSKALRDSASRIDVALLKQMGISERSIWAQVQDMCKEIALVETQNTVRRLRGIAVPRIQGKASFTGPGKAQIQLRNGQQVPIKADKFLIATGSSAFRAEGIPFDDRRVFDSDVIRELSYLPNRVAITGAGIIAIEYAKIFAKLGAEVYVIIRDNSFPSAMKRVGVDGEIAIALMEDLIESGVKLRFNCQVGKFVVPPSLNKPITIQLNRAKTNEPTGEALKVDTYLFAAGRIPNTKGLGLENAGIMTDERGRVLVDSGLQTSTQGTYAAGDVLGPPGLASTGIEQGAAAVDNMFTTDEPEAKKFDPQSYLSDPDRFPVGIWTNPEVAYIGLTKEAALERGIDAVEGIARYAETTRGRVSRSGGLLKLVVDQAKRELPVIGVSIIGEDACELVHYGMELVQSKRSLIKVLEACHAAVTYHELYKVAALNIDDQLEFGVQLRGSLPLDTLTAAKTKFQEVISALACEGDLKRVKASEECEPAVKIPFQEAEDIAVELGLMSHESEKPTDTMPPSSTPKFGIFGSKASSQPKVDTKTPGPDLAYYEFLEFLRQLGTGHTPGVSIAAAIKPNIMGKARGMQMV